MGDYTFYNCRNLTSVAISDGIINIGNDAFKNLDDAIFYAKGDKVKYMLVKSGAGINKIIKP